MENIVTENTDLISTIIQVINSICKNLLSSIDKNIFPLLDKLIFLDKGMISTGDKMNQIISASPSSGVLLLANCLFTAFILYYAGKLMLSHLTCTPIESPPRFFLRAFLAGITMNFSLSICEFLLESTSDITSFFCGLGESLFGTGKISFVSLNLLLNHSITESFDVFSLDGILSRNVILFFICTYH